jgi:hypothetical protein
VLVVVVTMVLVPEATVTVADPLILVVIVVR